MIKRENSHSKGFFCQFFKLILFIIELFTQKIQQPDGILVSFQSEFQSLFY